MPPILAEQLLHKIIPWSQQYGKEKCIVARPDMTQAMMPPGVTLSRRKMKGPRVIVKNRRYYRNVRSFVALWPEVGLNELGITTAIYVLGGQAHIQIGNHLLECNEGVFILIPPGTPQPDGNKTQFHSDQGSCDLLMFSLYPHALQCFIIRSRGKRKQVEFLENYLFQNSSLAEFFHFLSEELTHTPSTIDDIPKSLRYTFWLMLQRETNLRHYTNPGPLGRPPEPQAQKGFEAELLNYIQAHLKQSLCVEDVARGLYISRTQFIRRMREETGKSFVQYLTDYRIEEARALLHNSDWTIEAITGFLGFRSATYFRAVFKKATGVSPTDYRKQIHEK